MTYEIPEAKFSPNEHARQAVTAAIALKSSIKYGFINGYHLFWGVSDPPTGSIYTTEQLQAKIAEIGMAETIEILTEAAGLYKFLAVAYPGAVEEKYATAAFDYSITQNGIEFGDLKETWQTPPAPEPPPEEEAPE